MGVRGRGVLDGKYGVKQEGVLNGFFLPARTVFDAGGWEGGHNVLSRPTLAHELSRLIPATPSIAINRKFYGVPAGGDAPRRLY